MSKEKISPVEVIQLPKKSVPFIKPLLNSLRLSNIYFSQDDVIGYASDLNRNKMFQEIATSYLLSLAVRHAGDNTGILAPLIDVSRSKEQTRKIVQNIGSEILDSLDTNEKNHIVTILNNNSIIDENDLLKIDRLTGLAVTQIKILAYKVGLNNPSLDNMTPAAYAFREKNKEALNQLLELYDFRLYRLLNREDLYDYNRLTDIVQSPIIPRINIQPLLNILPDELNRNINSQAPPADEPLGIIARLNMAGSDIIRYFVRLTKEKRLSQAMQRDE